MFIRIAVRVQCVLNVLCSCFSAFPCLSCARVFVLELVFVIEIVLNLDVLLDPCSLFLDIVLCVCLFLKFVLVVCSLVLLFELVCFFVLCLARWFQFFVVVSVFGYVFLLLFVVIALVLSVLASPSIARKRICCGPSAKSGRQQIGRASNRLDRLRSIFVGRNQRCSHHFRPKPSTERGPTHHPHHILTHNPQRPILKIYNETTIIPHGSFQTGTLTTLAFICGPCGSFISPQK